MSYIPYEYWVNHGKTYKNEFRYNKNFELQEKILIDYLKNNVSSTSFSTVLEVGCGFGRITKLLLSNFPQIRDYLAIDLSPDQIENAKELIRPTIEAKGHVLNLTFVVSDIQSFQIQKKYDLVIASEVLMHILPSEIAQVMSKLISMSNEHVVNIDWYEQQPPSKAAPHNFIHQYEKLYRNIPDVLSVSRIPIVRKGSWLNSVDTKQFLFHATKKSVTNASL
ncbi:MAG TPA: class I SAM-dependent methyltransferase [Candidatus Nitrosopolaris sp.]|nr:class I SAM-dependent methyltransferase [Candidatus Nitrosopolaris sp.]